MQCVESWPCEGACGIAYALWEGDGLATVGDVESAFAAVCFAADQALGEPAGCRHFLNWYDQADRKAMIAALLPEVERALARRGAAESTKCNLCGKPMGTEEGTFHDRCADLENMRSQIADHEQHGHSAAKGGAA